MRMPEGVKVQAAVLLAHIQAKGLVERLRHGQIGNGINETVHRVNGDDRRAA